MDLRTYLHPCRQGLERPGQTLVKLFGLLAARLYTLQVELAYIQTQLAIAYTQYQCFGSGTANNCDNSRAAWQARSMPNAALNILYVATFGNGSVSHL